MSNIDAAFDMLSIHHGISLQPRKYWLRPARARRSTMNPTTIMPSMYSRMIAMSMGWSSIYCSVVAADAAWIAVLTDS